MNNTFYLKQKAESGDLNADLITRQCRLDKISKFMEVKSTNPRLKQSERAKELAISTSTLQRYRRKNVYTHPIEFYNHQTLTQENKRLQTIRPQVITK